jgi:hypothetical protein
MTQNEFYTCVGYLANPGRYTWIEAEMPNNAFASFLLDYSTWTGGFPLPLDTSHAPLYVWKPKANKWGKEMRIYFHTSDLKKLHRLCCCCVNQLECHALVMMERIIVE